MPTNKGIKLKYVIGLLIIFTICSITAFNWYLSIQSLKTTLTENYLENNYQYANKVALNTNQLFTNMQQNLSILAELIGKEEFSQSDLEYWRAANPGHFNSVFTTDQYGIVQLMSPLAVPNNKSVKPGIKITSDLMKQALKHQEPFISHPYLAQTGNLMVLISTPIFGPSGNYQGVVDGTIYLERDSSLKRMIEQHEFKDESSVFVVDQSGQIIFHPDSSRINESISTHPLVQDVMKGHSGAAQIINSRGTEYFSGYAFVEETGWGIIAQTPTSVLEEPLRELNRKMVVQLIPLLVIILLLAWIFTGHIAKSINKLAKFSEVASTTNQRLAKQHLEISSSIYEVRQLYQHFQNHIQSLNIQIEVDGLTGLLNRRTFDLTIEDWINQQERFSMIMLDIDHFKKVNDRFGHLVGDDVLRFLALHLQKSIRSDDKCFRFGGEEFIILLKDQGELAAFGLAERLRVSLSEMENPTGEPMTISLGISSYQGGNESPEEVIKRADSALYQSKNKGRNRTTIYEVRSA